MGDIQEEKKFLIQVDLEDVPVGLIEKKEAHLRGILHRAFSIFIFRKIGSSVELLLQQRALHKYHSGGLWTNTCCSHAEPGIAIDVTAKHRLQEEMGFSCPLSFLGSFYYKTEVGSKMTEHEIDYVFSAFYNPSKIRLNPEEANGCKWMTIELLQKELLSKPHEFTAWFPEAFKMALKFLGSAEKRKLPCPSDSMLE